MKLRWFSPVVVALAAAGASCSDPAGALPQGAIYIVVSPQDAPPPGTACSADGLPYSLPSGSQAVDAIRRNGGQGDDGEIYRVVDGDKDVDVSCTVKDGDTITLEGTIDKKHSVSFSVRGNISPTGGTVNISELDNNRVGRLSGECTVETEYVAAGAIWAHFTCPAFSAGTDQCQARGTFVFENCKK